MPQAGFNISNFRSVIAKDGLLRNNKFLVRFSPTQGLSLPSKLNQTLKNMEFRAEAVQLPGITHSTYQISRYGYGTMETKPHFSIFPSVSMIFLETSDGYIRKFFYEWLNSIINIDLTSGVSSYSDFNESSPYEISYMSDYIAHCDINQYKDTGEISSNIKLREIYPISINDSRLGWDDKEFSRVSVNFAMQDWYYGDIKDL